MKAEELHQHAVRIEDARKKLGVLNAMLKAKTINFVHDGNSYSLPMKSSEGYAEAVRQALGAELMKQVAVVADLEDAVLWRKDVLGGPIMERGPVDRMADDAVLGAVYNAIDSGWTAPKIGADIELDEGRLELVEKATRLVKELCDILDENWELFRSMATPGQFTDTIQGLLERIRDTEKPKGQPRLDRDEQQRAPGF